MIYLLFAYGSLYHGTSAWSARLHLISRACLHLVCLYIVQFSEVLVVVCLESFQVFLVVAVVKVVEILVFVAYDIRVMASQQVYCQVGALV